MKLIIQIPCLNEEDALPATLHDLPRGFPGIPEITSVEWLVIDDGSTDNTVAMARRCGVDHVVSHGRNKGLAQSFMTGLEACLNAGADIIVNTDADNQYCAADIEQLVRPIIYDRVDYVVGARPIATIAHFSPVKKMMQGLGSRTVKLLSGLDIADAPSGFRALSRETAYRLNVFNRYTYTIETLIQAGHSNIKTISVPIRVNGETRPSRLFRSIPEYIRRSMGVILRFFVLYKAFGFLSAIGGLLFGAGLLIGVRFLYLNFGLGETGHIQSVVLAGLLLSIGFMTVLTGILADLISLNRRLLEEIRRRVMMVEHRLNRPDDDAGR